MSKKFANLLADVGEPNWAGDENIFKEVCLYRVLLKNWF